MEPMKEYDLIKGGDTIRTDWRLSLLKCIRDPGKITDKKIKWQVLKYTSIADEFYWRTIDGMLSVWVRSKLRWQFRKSMMEFVEHTSQPRR
jgi:hypothetical protein